MMKGVHLGLAMEAHRARKEATRLDAYRVGGVVRAVHAVAPVDDARADVVGQMLEQAAAERHLPARWLALGRRGHLRRHSDLGGRDPYQRSPSHDRRLPSLTDDQDAPAVLLALSCEACDARRRGSRGLASTPAATATSST